MRDVRNTVITGAVVATAIGVADAVWTAVVAFFVGAAL